MINYDKDTFFKEFNVAKNKDIALATELLSKSKKSISDIILDNTSVLETTVYTNRIEFFKDHIKCKKEHPKYYNLLDVNLDELLKAYESENPRDYFYISMFGKTFAQKKAEEASEIDNEKLANI